MLNRERRGLHIGCVPMGSFQDLGISDALAEVLSSQGINEPFEVQVESIPPAMEGKDVSCRAPTGSGKTTTAVKLAKNIEKNFNKKIILK